VIYEEKAVNTRSQGVMAPAAVASNSADEDAADNSLMARRRRRRERAQTAYIMHGPSVDGIVQPSTIISTSIPPDHHHLQQQQQQPAAVVEGHQMTLAERRLLRAAYSFNSVDNDDVFYDAVPTTLKQLWCNRARHSTSWLLQRSLYDVIDAQLQAHTQWPSQNFGLGA